MSEQDPFEKAVDQVLREASTGLECPRGVVLIGDDKQFAFRLPGGLAQALGAVSLALADSEPALRFFMVAVKAAKEFRKLRRNGKSES